MSIKRVYTVKSARQRFAKDASTTTRVPVLNKKTGLPKVGRGGAPMMRRIASSDKERPLPNYKCGHCGVEIQVGESYRYWEPYFRSNAKAIRCMKASCTPKMSELESSKLSGAYSAQEDAESSLEALRGAPGDTSDIESIVSEMGDSLDEVAQEYREADEQFGGGGNTESGEKADTLENTASDLQNFSSESDENDEWCELHEDGNEEGLEGSALDAAREACDECKEKLEAWWGDRIDEALTVVQEAEFS